jgi:hypothetical protein
MSEYLHSGCAEAPLPFLAVDSGALDGPAVGLFVKLAANWGLTGDQCMTLMGGMARQTWQNWKKGKVAALGRDQRDRLSLIFGIQKGLRTVFADDAAGLRWLQGANTDAPFAGKSPLDRMLDGGIDDLFTVRRYLDAWRGVR